MRTEADPANAGQNSVQTTRRPHVLIMGPPAGPQLLEPARHQLERHGCIVTTCYAESADAIDRAVLREIDAALWLGVPCGPAEMDAAPRLRALIVPTIGYDFIDEKAASHRAILIANGEVVENFESMAEAAMLFILASLYDLPGAQAQLRGTGDRRPAHMLRGRTIGLVGYGNIARCLIDRLQGWGVNILVHRRKTGDPDPRFRQTSLDELLRAADILVLLASLNPGSRHLIGSAELAKMKEDAIMVNLSRGALIDEAALTRHAMSGRLAALALDTFDEEPLPTDSPLRSLPNAILTPHAIGHTRESFAAIPRAAVANAISALEGRMPGSVRNAEVELAWRARHGRPWVLSVPTESGEQ